jgi:hypothetical protein
MAETDHTSYLSRHRPICTVIEEIKEKVEKLDGSPNPLYIDLIPIVALCNEAKDYAQRMSARLMEYKRKEKGDGS